MYLTNNYTISEPIYNFYGNRGLHKILDKFKGKENENIEVATLMAGDFVGEQAVLRHTKRTATCKTITPCILYILKRNDFEILISRFPEMYKIILKESEKRL